MADASQGLMGGADPSLLLNLGLGLMNAGAPHLGMRGNVGEALQGAMGNYYQQKLSGQQYQMNALTMQKTKAMFHLLGGLMGDPAPSGQDATQQPSQNALPASAPPSAGVPGASVSPVPGSAPQGAPMPSTAAPPMAPGGAQSAAPSWLTPPSMSDISQIPIGGMNPRAVQGYRMLTGGDPIAASKETRDQQLQIAQQRYAPAIAKLDTLIKSDSPGQYAGADPDLKAAWQQLAPHFGFDPDKDFNDSNVRTAMTFARNSLASSIGKETIAPSVAERTTQGPLGSIYQTDPLTGKQTQVKGQEELKSVIGANGQPTLVPASKATGMTPFNPTIFGAGSMSDQGIQMAADTYRTTGKMPANFARSPLLQARVFDRIASDATASGDSAGAIAARSAGLKANSQALDQVTKLESATTSYYNTLDKNLTNLQELQGKVDSSGVPLVNRVYRAWQQGIAGDPAVAKYVTYLNAVEGEYAKIQSGSLGNAPTTDAAKRDAKDVINKFMSSGQVSAVADAMRGEGSNRLQSIREQKSQLSGQLGQNAPGSAAAAPAAGDHPADIQALLNKYGSR